jgi:hypothetical protein
VTYVDEHLGCSSRQAKNALTSRGCDDRVKEMVAGYRNGGNIPSKEHAAGGHLTSAQGGTQVKKVHEKSLKWSEDERAEEVQHMIHSHLYKN